MGNKYVRPVLARRFKGHPAFLRQSIDVPGSIGAVAPTVPGSLDYRDPMITCQSSPQGFEIQARNTRTVTGEEDECGVAIPRRIDVHLHAVDFHDPARRQELPGFPRQPRSVKRQQCNEYYRANRKGNV